MGYDGTLKFDTSIDSSGFQDGISKIGSCASTALKATTAIIGGAATAVVGIGTAAIKPEQTLNRLCPMWQQYPELPGMN